jgi:ubiquinone/menaquinone biosynthesis C-methylase UbiE
MPDSPESFLPEIVAHYATGYEEQRLLRGTSQLELVRTQEIVLRYLPLPPAVILDVGGGPGAYSLWLARLGYEVHLLDAMPLHIEQAETASLAQTDHPIASISLGDARHLDRADASVDVVLLMGPLYHLTEREDRIGALKEANRVLREGGIVIAAAISRFASTLDGTKSGYIDDPEFRNIVESDLFNGQHRNPNNHPAYFTTAYFHHPDEIKDEIEAAGLVHEKSMAVEGFAWLLGDFAEIWADTNRCENMLRMIRAVEEEPSLLGVSAHLISVARKR